MGPYAIDGVGAASAQRPTNQSATASQPVSTSSGAGRAAAATTSGAEQQNPAGEGLTVGSSSSLVMTAVSVQAQVDGFLQSFGSELAGDQQLRMVIALLILQALMRQQRDEGDVQGGEMAVLNAAAEALGRRPSYTVFSETNIIQMQHQSTLLITDQAVQTLDGSASGGGQVSTGENLDVNA